MGVTASCCVWCWAQSAHDSCRDVSVWFNRRVYIASRIAKRVACLTAVVLFPHRLVIACAEVSRVASEDVCLTADGNSICSSVHVLFPSGVQFMSCVVHLAALSRCLLDWHSRVKWGVRYHGPMVPSRMCNTSVARGMESMLWASDSRSLLHWCLSTFVYLVCILFVSGDANNADITYPVCSRAAGVSKLLLAPVVAVLYVNTGSSIRCQTYSLASCPFSRKCCAMLFVSANTSRIPTVQYQCRV